MGIKIKMNGAWVNAETLIKVDETLTEPGQSADAYETGSKIRAMEQKFNELKNQVPTVPIVMEEVEEKLSEYNFVNAGAPVGAWAIKNGGTGAITSSEALKNLQGVSFTELWRYPLDNYYDTTADGLFAAYEDAIYPVVGIGDSTSYPYLLITSQRATVLLPNRNCSTLLTYCYYDEANYAMWVGGRPVKIDADNGTVTFGKNRVAGLTQNAISGDSTPPWPAAYGSNTSNKPWSIIGISNVTNLEGEINKLASRVYGTNVN